MKKINRGMMKVINKMMIIFIRLMKLIKITMKAKIKRRYNYYQMNLKVLILNLLKQMDHQNRKIIKQKLMKSTKNFKTKIEKVYKRIK